MRILLVTTHARLTPQIIATAQRQVGVPKSSYEILSLHLPVKNLPAKRHMVAAPSLVPWRPLLAVSTRDVAAPAPNIVERLVRAVVRRARAVLAKAPIPTRMRTSPGRMLAIACSTSKIPTQMARDADVVVAMDDAACWGAWLLSRRVDGTTFVNRPAHVGQVLASR